MRYATAVIVLTSLAIGIAPASDASAGRLELVSRASDVDGAKANRPAVADDISADGRVITFATRATNLDPSDTNGRSDVYVRDVATSTTILISRASGAEGAVGNGKSRRGSISADGQVIAFTSTATNLDPLATPPSGPTYVYVRDLSTATTTLVSRADGFAGQPADADSLTPMVSANGRFVVYFSFAMNLTPEQNGIGQIYVRDLVAGRTFLGSARPSDSAPANEDTFSPSISSDGSRVAFASSATNLGPSDPLGQDVAFVRDYVTQSILTASRKDGAGGSVQPGFDPSISDDGDQLVFQGGGLAKGEARTSNSDIYLRDIDEGKTIWVSRGVPDANDTKPPFVCSRDATTSADGKFTVFQTFHCSHGSDKLKKRFVPRVYFRDLSRNKAVAIKGAAGRKGSDDPLIPEVSADGRWVAFASRLRNPRAGDLDEDSDAYVVRSARGND